MHLGALQPLPFIALATARCDATQSKDGFCAEQSPGIDVRAGNLKEENAQLRVQLAEKDAQLAEKEEQVRREKRAREAAEEEVRREKRLRDSLERSVTALQARLKSAGQTAPLGVRQQQQQAQVGPALALQVFAGAVCRSALGHA